MALQPWCMRWCLNKNTNGKVTRKQIFHAMDGTKHDSKQPIFVNNRANCVSTDTLVNSVYRVYRPCTRSRSTGRYNLRNNITVAMCNTFLGSRNDIVSKVKSSQHVIVNNQIRDVNSPCPDDVNLDVITEEDEEEVEKEMCEEEEVYVDGNIFENVFGVSGETGGGLIEIDIDAIGTVGADSGNWEEDNTKHESVEHVDVNDIYILMIMDMEVTVS